MSSQHISAYRSGHGRRQSGSGSPRGYERQRGDAVAPEVERPHRQFWVLAAFLTLVFLTGGSAQPDPSSLMILRPIAVLVMAYGVFTMQASQWRQYRHLIIFIAALVLLLLLHLMPLPPSIWHRLPGRDIVRQVDQVAGIGDPWRPLSMVPLGTWNALYSLAVPVAVFSLVVQQNLTDNKRLMLLLIAFAALSGFVGLLQASGADLRLYALATNTAGLFANRNHQGTLLALLLPMLAVMAVFNRGVGLDVRWMRILAASLAIIAVPLIIVTGSRGGLIVALIALLLVPFMRLFSLRGHSQRKFMIAGILGGIVVIGATAASFAIFAARDNAITRIGSENEDPRYPVWVSIVEVLPQYMPWGTGVGSYADAYQVQEPAKLLRPTFSNHAHNDYLEVLFTMGIPGALLFLWALVLFALGVPKSLSAPGFHGVFSRLGLVLIVLIAFASAADYPARTPIIASILAIASVWASSFKRVGNEIEG